MLRLAQGGDKSAFCSLVSSHGGIVFQHLLRMMGGRREEAEDLTQETFLRAYRSIKKFRHQSRFRTWLRKIATNIALNELRKRRPFCQSLDASEEEGWVTEIPDVAFAPEQSMDQKEAQALVDKALSQLSDSLRIVFVLKELEGYSHEETARLLGVKPQAVRVRHHRAKKILAQNLAELHVGYRERQGVKAV